MKNKTIVTCPVCNHSDIQQHLENNILGDEFIISGTGSHCNNCGVTFIFNTSHLQQDIDKERQSFVNLKYRLITGKGVKSGK